MNKNLLLCLLFLLMISCEKEGKPVIENQGVRLLQKVFIGDMLYQEYSYNEENLVTEERTRFHYTRHYYNDNNLLIKSDIYWDEAMVSSNSTVASRAMNREEWVNPENTRKSITNTFDYNDRGQLIRKGLFRTGSDIPEYAEYSYNSGRISRQTWYRNDIQSVFFSYEYDARGNLIKEMKYSVSDNGTANLLTTTEYEFDNMKNPYLSFSRLTTPGLFTNENNIVKKTYTSYIEYDPSYGQPQVSSTVYEYNNDGYPVKVNGVTTYVYR